MHVFVMWCKFRLYLISLCEIFPKAVFIEKHIEKLIFEMTSKATEYVEMVLVYQRL